MEKNKNFIHGVRAEIRSNRDSLSSCCWGKMASIDQEAESETENLRKEALTQEGSLEETGKMLKQGEEKGKEFISLT